MAKFQKAKFPNHICVRRDRDDGQLLIVGTPDRISELDADDGDRVVTYTLNGPVKIYRQHPRLEK